MSYASTRDKEIPPTSSDAAHVTPEGVTHTLSKNQRRQLESRIAEIEKLIPTLEGESEKLTLEMARPGVASDFPKLNELTEKHRHLDLRIKSLYEEWDEASRQLQ
jgi:hypothetical protein